MLKSLLGRYEIFENKKLFSMLVIIFYCIRVLASGWLAFDIEGHAIFQSFISISGKIAMCIALVYIVFVQKKVTCKNMILCLLPTIYIILILMREEESGYFSYSIVSIVAIYIFLLLSDKIKIKIVQAFYVVVLVSIVICTFAYVYLLFGFPAKIVSYYTETYITNYYYQFGPLAILSSDGLLRMCGPFNEGGNLGTTCAFLYAIFDKKNTRIEKIILIIGISLSFSLAGWILLLIYWMTDLLLKGKIRNVILVGGIITIVLALPKIDFGNIYVNTFVQRFSISSDGLSGDNRTWEGFDRQYNNTIDSSKKWWGQGLSYKIEDGSSYKSYIITYGYLGTIILVLPWLIACISIGKKNKQCFIFILLFFVSLYQRPAPITSLYGYAMMFGGLQIIIMKRIEKDKHTKHLIIEKQ